MSYGTHSMDIIRRGPQRWERARRNAERKPHTQAAALYRERVERADAARDSGMYDDGPREFLTRVFVKGHAGPKLNRDFTTCSVWCTAMQAQVEYHADVALALRPTGQDFYITYGNAYVGGVYPRDVCNIRGHVRCQCCGAHIYKDGRIVPQTVTLPDFTQVRYERAIFNKGFAAGRASAERVASYRATARVETDGEAYSRGLAAGRAIEARIAAEMPRAVANGDLMPLVERFGDLLESLRFMAQGE